MEIKWQLLGIAISALLIFANCGGNSGAFHFYPGQPWLDTSGSPINAHGGGVIYANGEYYWYGEHKLPGLSEEQKADGGVHCYSSTNLYRWHDRGLVLEVDYNDPQSDIPYGCILERPKVVFNEETCRYVMYFKLYPAGTGYEAGYTGVAFAEAPGGPFIYSHKFLAADSDKGSGDFCMYRSKDGPLYHFTVRKPDKAFVIGRLSDDYSFPAGEYTVFKGIPLHTEAPAVAYANGIYYLAGSGSTGWEPNSARSFMSQSIHGQWTDTGNPCMGTNPHNGLNEEKTFGGQISCLFPVAGKKEMYIAMFDIWRPDMPVEGLYVWLPAFITPDGLKIKWMHKWDLSVFDD